MINGYTFHNLYGLHGQQDAKRVILLKIQFVFPAPETMGFLEYRHVPFHWLGSG